MTRNQTPQAWGRHGGGNGRATIALALLLALTTTPSRAAAVTVAAVGGADHYAGPGQTTNGAVAALVLGAAGGDLTLAGVRFDNSRIGWGYSLTTSVGVPLTGSTLLRITGTRVLGDESFGSWRAIVGPQFVLPGGQKLSLSYAHYRDNLAGRSNGLVAGATTTLAERLSGTMNVSYALVPSGPSALQGSVGLGWSLMRSLELSAEVGAVRDAAGTSGASSPGGGSSPGLPLLGGGPLSGGAPSSGGGSATGPGVERTLLLSLRKSFP